VPTFTPPTVEGYRTLPGDDTVWNRMARYYDRGRRGLWVLKEAGTWSSVESPDLNRLVAAQRVFEGGHLHEVTQAEADELIAAGFSSGINIAPVEGTWKSEQLTKYSRWTLTASPGNVSALSVDGSERLNVKLTESTQQGQTGLREWFIHSDLEGTDFVARTIMDPPFFGSKDGVDILPQTGLVVRAQQSGGVNTGIIVNNNIIFGVPQLNIGVWRSNTDGTGFVNRQFGTPVFSNPAFPYGFDFRLAGNIATVGYITPEHNQVGPIYTVNLDTEAGDAGAIPTPTGKGKVGIVAAHLGGHADSACRYRRTTWRLL
jgi:hypothetical protein